MGTFITNELPRIRVRKRIKTCDLPDEHDGNPTFISGKPGISCCRFSPNSQLFATGGWDYRCRVYTRSGIPCAILKLHSKSVTTLDWIDIINDSKFSEMQFLFTGSADRRIGIWHP